MKKLLFIVILLTSVMALAQPYPIRLPEGGICDSGATAAATLLIPYWEVDASDPAGIDTLVGITNVHDYSIVAHVTSWNVDSWSTFDFNIYMTPYDVVTFSMRQIMINGLFPNNFCGGDDNYRFIDGPIDCDGDGQYLDNVWTLNDGLFSVSGYNMDIACYRPASAAWIEDKQCKHSIASYDGPTENYVGYLTIDVTMTCNGGTPDGILSYYATNYLDTEPCCEPIVSHDGIVDHGVLENSNALLGDYFYYDNTKIVADGYPAVHIEAWGEDNSAGLLAGTACTSATSTPGTHCWGMHALDNSNGIIQTYYNKYLTGSGYDFVDHRETLPLRWGFRYILNAGFDGGTWIDAWRSHNPRFDHWYVGGGPCNFPGVGAAYTVLYDYVHGSFPDDMGLHPVPYIIYSEDEETTGGDDGPSPPPDAAVVELLRLETQRVNVADDFAPAWEAGWIAVAFDTDFLYDWVPFCVTSICSFDQSWLNVRYSALNKYTVGLSGVAYKGGCWMDALTGTAPVSMQITPSH